MLVSGIKPSFNNWFLIISKKNVGKQNVVGHEDHTNYLLGKKFYLNFTEEVERVFYMY